MLCSEDKELLCFPISSLVVFSRACIQNMHLWCILLTYISPSCQFVVLDCWCLLNVDDIMEWSGVKTETKVDWSEVEWSRVMHACACM